VVTPYQQSPQTTNYSTNNLSEYTSVGGASQSSDANGNLVDNGTYLFLYDYKNHIVQVKDKSSGSVLASYRYDALGRRVEKNVGGAVQRHILSWSRFSDAGLLLSTAAKTNLSEAERIQDLSHVVAVYDDSNNWLQNFVWSDEIDGIQMLEQKDVLDYDTDGNTTEITRSFYHRNALGSVMEITDMNQAEVVSYRYDPYGKVTITVGGTPQSSDPLGNHWTFAGMFLDEESALLYCRARHCDPCTGRFAQRDPLGVAAGPSLFVYVDNRPPNERDPSGLQGSHCRLSEYFTEGADKFMEKLDEEIAAGRKDSGNLNDLVGFGVGTFASYAGCVISERLFGYNDYPRGFGPYAAADTPFGLQLGLQYYDHDFSFLGGHHFEFTAHVGIAIAGLWTMDDLRTLDNSNGDIAIAAGFAIKF